MKLQSLQKYIQIVFKVYKNEYLEVSQIWDYIIRQLFIHYNISTCINIPNALQKKQTKYLT